MWNSSSIRAMYPSGRLSEIWSAHALSSARMEITPIARDFEIRIHARKWTGHRDALGQEAMQFPELYQLSISQAPAKCRLSRRQPRPSDLDSLGDEGRLKRRQVFRVCFEPSGASR